MRRVEVGCVRIGYLTAVPYPSLILCGFLACITINAGVCGKFTASDVPFSVGQCHKNNINAYLTVNFLSTRTPCHIRDRPLAVLIGEKFEQRLRFGVQLLSAGAYILNSPRLHVTSSLAPNETSPLQKPPRLALLLESHRNSKSILRGTQVTKTN